MTEIFRESATADGNSSVFTWKALRAEKGNTGTWRFLELLTVAQHHYRQALTEAQLLER